MAFGDQIVLDCFIHCSVQGFYTLYSRISSRLLDRRLQTAFGRHVLQGPTLVYPFFFYG